MLRNGWLVACATLFALLSGCTSAVPDRHDTDVAALKDTEAAWVKDAETRDVDKFVAHYSDDAAVLLPDTPVLIGKAAISAALKPLMADPNFAVTFAATKVDVAKSGDLGYTRGPYSMTVSHPVTKAPTVEKGKYLTIFRKQADGTWKAVEDTFMSDGPPPPAAAK